MPDCDIQLAGADGVRIRERSADVETVVDIDLSTEQAGKQPLLQVRCQPKGATVEKLSAK